MLADPRGGINVLGNPDYISKMSVLKTLASFLNFGKNLTWLARSVIEVAVSNPGVTHFLDRFLTFRHSKM